MTDGEWREFGYANGWIEVPEMIRKCREMGHREERKSLDGRIGSTRNSYCCPICKYSYKVDSGD